MNILLLSKIIPDEIKDEVRAKSKNTMQDAAISLQREFPSVFQKTRHRKVRY